jgi:uncharacterized membrane protein YuzA (DUF378 family)
MNIASYAFCIVVVLLGVVETCAFFRWRSLFRYLSLVIMLSGLPLLTGFVGFNLGYVLGALEQNLAIPGMHFSIVDDMLDGPIPMPLVYCLIGLTALTLALRFAEERRQRKTQ